MTISANTPLFKPSSAALGNTNKLKNEWTLYVDNIYGDIYGDINAESHKELLDYNIESYTAPVEYGDLKLLGRLSMMLYYDFFAEDFIGFRLRKLYDLSNKDDDIADYICSLQHIVGYQQNAVDFLCVKKEPGLIKYFYGHDDKQLAELFYSQLIRNGAFDPNTIYIASYIYSMENLENMLPHLADLTLTHHLGCLLEVTKDFESFLTLLDHEKNNSVETLFVLHEIAYMIRERGLYISDVQKGDELTTMDALHQEVLSAETLLSDTFKMKYPADYQVYSMLKSLDFNRNDIWKQLSSNVDVTSTPLPGTL